MTNIKSAVESLVAQTTKKVNDIPKEELSFESSLVRNPLLRLESYFMQAMKHNDPNLRAIFQDSEFNPDLDVDMEDALERVETEIKNRLQAEILAIVLKYRAYFNEDPNLVIEDIKVILDNLTSSISTIVAECDEDVADQGVYREGIDFDLPNVPHEPFPPVDGGPFED